MNCNESRSGFVEEYENKIYRSLIGRSIPLLKDEVDSKLSCLFSCLNLNDCSIIQFNPINFQCLIYNTYPIIDQELLDENNSFVWIFKPIVKLSISVVNTNLLVSRLNNTSPSKIIPLGSPRCLIIDRFGYLLTIVVLSNLNYINRYDRTNLDLIDQRSLSMTSTAIGMLSYINQMIFVSPSYNNNISIFDDIHLNLLGRINCGSMLSQPRDIIYIENQKMLIIASQMTSTLVFVRFYSPTNSTCLNKTSALGDPQSLLKLNDTFFYLTSWGANCIYSYHYNGQQWIGSLFADVIQTLGLSYINLGHLQIDNIGRRWIMVVRFGLIIYDQWGHFLASWQFGQKPFDIYIYEDYRLLVSDIANSSLIFYEPKFIL